MEVITFTPGPIASVSYERGTPTSERETARWAFPGATASIPGSIASIPGPIASISHERGTPVRERKTAWWAIPGATAWRVTESGSFVLIPLHS